ncbi:SDR family oxidoreductase [Microscilla marina]|uniref:Dehydrogenase/reductase SDR family member 7 n=1 Tax=Microscilla marina ATCC 23134 TaxID=313606 RepID=A1ZDF7_MICM2|nr:SDR family oxidoreductase [Microscilla marina]EAY31696.1 dehydrogenase/reductase SDR family member 7 [Microscilla marina ATCC 23134]
MSKFTNKVIWITGASSGIGEALAYHFAAQNARLVLSARRQTELERVKKQCGAAADVLVLPLDLAQSNTFADKVAEVVQKFGQIDYLINNGGISQRSLIKETLAEVDRQIMEVNYFGNILLTKAVLPHMVAQKQGHVTIISSVAGKLAAPLRSTYSASKAAVISFFETVRAEYHHNVEVLVVCPGYIQTNVSVNALTGDGSAQNTMDSTTGSGILPERCAALIASAIRKRKQQVIISGAREKLGIIVKKFFPRLFAHMVRKAKVA